ncbi:homocysteine S-methyltransferase YbgG-like isoform X2 [Eriocheir sinensis]|nr:homocysteine S-methyltransferase YbgG-like isoform X2 [Eriocheir sinensis]
MLTGRMRVLDGGLASTLQASGFEVDGDPLWSARLLSTHPQAIREAHTAFLNSGAQVIESASYQASVPSLQRHLGTTAEEALGLIRLSATLATEAMEGWEEARRRRGEEEEGTPRITAGSVGPYGACQADGSEYTGAYLDTVPRSELVAWHRPRVQALVGAGLGLLALETIPGLAEALALLEVVKEWPEVKVWVSFSCKDGQHTSYGDPFGEAVKACYERGGGQLVGVGVNCTPPELITPLLQEAASHLPPPDVLPRVVYPNSGERWVAGKGWEGGGGGGGGSWPFLAEVGVWGGLGARLVGGCCRLGPGDIKDIAGVVNGVKVT